MFIPNIPPKDELTNININFITVFIESEFCDMNSERRKYRLNNNSPVSKPIIRPFDLFIFAAKNPLVNAPIDTAESARIVGADCGSCFFVNSIANSKRKMKFTIIPTIMPLHMGFISPCVSELYSFFIKILL